MSADAYTLLWLLGTPDMRHQRHSRVQAFLPILTKPIRAVLKQCNDLLIVGKKTVNIGTPLEKLEPIPAREWVEPCWEGTSRLRKTPPFILREPQDERSGH